MTVRGFRGVVLAALALAGAAGGPPRPLAAAAPPLGGLPVLLVPIGTVTSLRVPHLRKTQVPQLYRAPHVSQERFGKTLCNPLWP